MFWSFFPPKITYVKLIFEEYTLGTLPMHRNQPVSATNSLGSLRFVKILQVLIVDVFLKVGDNPNRVLFGGGRYIRPEVIKLLQTVNCDSFLASSNLSNERRVWIVVKDLGNIILKE